jgi:ElaB/YqjD/DUF883 family membrane-anchored ribosome-binding protein
MAVLSRIALSARLGFIKSMSTLQQIEAEVKQLSQAERDALRTFLDNLDEDALTLKDEFKAELDQAKADLAAGQGRVGDAAKDRTERMKQFFTQWDATHVVTVGETPSRARTYADNSRLR